MDQQLKEIEEQEKVTKERIEVRLKVLERERRRIVCLFNLGELATMTV